MVGSSGPAPASIEFGFIDLSGSQAIVQTLKVTNQLIYLMRLNSSAHAGHYRHAKSLLRRYMHRPR